MQSGPFRRELVSWMRLSDAHPRAGLDGMDRDAMRMSKAEAFAAPLVFTKFWSALNVFGATKGITHEAKVILTSPVIALFYIYIHENPVASGQAYLRLCFEAASLGFAGWPMAALSDHPVTQSEVTAQFGIPSGRRFIQAIRFGIPTGAASCATSGSGGHALIDGQPAWDSQWPAHRADLCCFACQSVQERH